MSLPFYISEKILKCVTVLIISIVINIDIKLLANASKLSVGPFVKVVTLAIITTLIYGPADVMEVFFSKFALTLATVY